MKPMCNPTTGETRAEADYRRWLEQREEAHVAHLIAVENKTFSASVEASLSVFLGVRNSVRLSGNTRRA